MHKSYLYDGWVILEYMVAETINLIMVVQLPLGLCEKFDHSLNRNLRIVLEIATAYNLKI